MRSLTLLLFLGWAHAQPVVDAPHLRLVADPGPTAPESPPTKTLWLKTPVGWQAVAKVLDVAPGGGAWLSSEGELVVAGEVVDHAVLPGLSVGPDGAVAYARSVQAPVSDVWLWDGKQTRPITTDGRSDRPLVLADGRLLWVSGAGGVAGFVLDGWRLTNEGRYQVPVPARPGSARQVGDTVEYDAGDGWWRLDLRSGEASPIK